MGIKGKKFSIIKNINDKLWTNVRLKGEKLKALPWDQEQDRDICFYHSYWT